MGMDLDIPMTHRWDEQYIFTVPTIHLQYKSQPFIEFLPVPYGCHGFGFLFTCGFGGTEPEKRTQISSRKDDVGDLSIWGLAIHPRS